MKDYNTTIIAHLYKQVDGSGNWVIQSNQDHCAGVAELAASFADEFGMSNHGRLLGLLHDRGKEKIDFQKYIRSVSGFDEKINHWSDKSHSLVGAILSHHKFRDLCYVFSNIIAGHHRGLYDISELELLLKNKLPDEVDNAVPQLPLERPGDGLERTNVSHLTRMLFSCLVDADYLDTERFMNPDDFASRKHQSNMPMLKQHLDVFMQTLYAKPKNKLNILRNEIQDCCKIFGNNNPGFFELTVPTGGGKTIASVIWAINHALAHNKKRIIIAIPYTSIIVQTAETLRTIFGDENVLEHHSVVADDHLSEKNKLATENWDAPIIVTTNVQLLESMFSNRPGACRKLHSLCNSIVIFDEVQSLPLTFLQPVVDAFKTYVKMFGTSILFCTASQPILDGKHQGLGDSKPFIGIDSLDIRRIINPEMNLHVKLRRVRMVIDKIYVPVDELTSRILVHNRVLCIVNTRRLALEVFNRLPNEGFSFHLSRMMCPLHIRNTIDAIKKVLQTGTSRPIRVVSTQLIEAGVDIDFPVVFRQLAGLDSLLQAAGRCNREGTVNEGVTYVFNLEHDRSCGTLGFAIDAMRQMLSQYPDSDWFSPETMKRYYDILYAKTPGFDKNRIGELLDDPRNAAYEEASKQFKLIDESGTPVIVNYGDARTLIESLRATGPSRRLMQRLGLYTVTIRQNLFKQMQCCGLIEEPWPGIFYIPLENQYDERTGLKTDNAYQEQMLII